MNGLVSLAEQGIHQLFQVQKEALGLVAQLIEAKEEDSQ